LTRSIFQTFKCGVILRLSSALPTAYQKYP